MLNSKFLIKITKPLSALLTVVPLLLFLVSCMPQSTAPKVDASNSSGNGNPTPGPITNYPEPNFPLDGIFIQEGAVRTKSNFALNVSFNDSFLVRGLALSTYLRTLPNTTKFCMVGKFTHNPGNDKFLVLAAKPKSFTDLIHKTTEYYLQVEPANDTANQNDCLTYNLSNSLFANASNPSLSFSLSQLCSDCSSAVSSQPLRLFFINGEEVPAFTLGSMFMTISGSSSSTGNTCVENTACRARGFDCCLQGQCVTDGAIRPSVNPLDPNFISAKHDVDLNPSRFVLYPQYYFVCETRPEGGAGSGPGNNGPDPDYEAAIRLMEQTQLYQCLNKVDGEFSYCTIKFTQASQDVDQTFSGADLGYFDDVNFTSLNPNLAHGDYKNNVVKITYGGQVLYELNKTALTGATINAANDNLTQSQSITLTSTLPANAQDDNLYLTYKVDGTCEKVGTTMARCTKTYIQGSSEPQNTTWHDSSKIYRLPSYADLSANASVIVKISDIVVPEDSSTWVKTTSPKGISFNSSYPIYQNQKIEITYYVTSNVQELMQMRSAAQSIVNTMCSCVDSQKCNLKPVMTEGAVTSYECHYPTSSSNEPPANQTVYVSNKNVPHRYFDVNGVNYDEDYGSAPAQELTAFTYTNNDTLKPNNVSQYVGFNEIYGSFAKTGNYAARPAKMVRVKKDKQYDIIVNSGVFSSCQTCGYDYYSTLKRLFPSSFASPGGGYVPDYYETKKERIESAYRSDDLLYGRACFVPATMIPWTHVAGSNPREQRRNRLAGQHFLFANGYNRDWYGFDYGSLIGSFDGVRWFSIGSERRIKATSGRLFLAVNGYFGDLGSDSNFNVLVSESSPYSSDIPDHDTETDGAQCQRAHFCSTDNDCVRQLGYDYTCQNVTGLMTEWPQFDGNGTEVSGTIERTLASIVGGTNGQSKRCVYRGKGAPCLADLTQANGQTFNGSSNVGTLACSPNNTCAALNSAKFNDRIARFAAPPISQNSAEVVTPPSDIVGLGARLIGRPFDYYGNKSVPPTASTSLTSNLVGAVCVPGKDIVGSTSNFDLNKRMPANRTETSDKILGIGATLSGNNPNAKYLNACPATNESGTAVQFLDLPLNDPNISKYTIAQNLSSNLLTGPSLNSIGIFNSTNGSKVTDIGYQRNACLRAPGATCFSDMECAPSAFIESKVRLANIPTSEMNEAEQAFWKEGLVCGNPNYKYLAPGEINPDFKIQDNKCCREIGKEITVYTTINETSPYQWCVGNSVNVAGVNSPLQANTRYSRVHTGYDKMTCDVPTAKASTTTKFALSLRAPDSITRFDQILEQYKTLDTINSRTCCTQNWVRKFDKDNAGGGHSFARVKMQTIDKSMFKNISWFAQNTAATWTTDAPFECNPEHFMDSSCEIRSFTDLEAEKYLKWGSSLELIGIPQVAIRGNDLIHQITGYDHDDDLELGQPGYNSTLDQRDITARKRPLKNSIKDIYTLGEDFADSSETPAAKYYSAANYNAFEMGTLKKVFSENEFNCCVPSGSEIPESVGPSECCTGYVANVDGPRRCCLPNNTDLTVYLNRYVSSEGRGLPDSAYDPKTGYIKDPGMVMQIASQKGLCCSGVMTTGYILNNYSIPTTTGTYPVPVDSLSTSRRFNYRSDIVDNNEETGNKGSYVDGGLRWNNHVYCVDKDFQP